jgi:hypothetical protein
VFEIVMSGGKLSLPSWKSHRFGKVLDPMFAEIDKREGVAEQQTRLAGDEYLATVTCGCDTCAAMNVEADVSLICDNRFTAVQADAHVDRAAAEVLLGHGCGGERVARICEGDEESIALRVNLNAVV